MSERRTVRTLLYCSLLAACCPLLLGCGQVGEPLPPLLKIPARVDGFEARQFEDRVLVRWNPPLLTTEGAALENLDRVVVYAVEIARDNPPASPEALAPYFKVVAEAEGETTEVDLPASDRFGQRTAFAVQAATTKGKLSPWSEVAVLDLKQPPASPTDLRAEAFENGVRLAWAAVEGAAGYVVERAAADGEFEPVAEPSVPQVDDATAEFDVDYRYRVRARADSATGAVPGPASEAVSITPQDSFAPAAPTGLRAIRTPQSVELSWAASSEADLAGYRVELAGAALHEGLLTTPAFSHSGAPASAAYSIIAVDDDGNASEASSIEVE